MAINKTTVSQGSGIADKVETELTQVQIMLSAIAELCQVIGERSEVELATAMKVCIDKANLACSAALEIVEGSA